MLWKRNPKFRSPYSGTSINGHSPLRTLFRKVDRFCDSASTWTVQNSLDNADAGRPLAQDCPASLIDPPTGHCTNTATHSFNLWLSFPSILQQGRAVERTFVALIGNMWLLVQKWDVENKEFTNQSSWNGLRAWSLGWLGGDCLPPSPHPNYTTTVLQLII